MTWRPISTAPADGKPVLLFLARPVDTNGAVGWAPAMLLNVVVGWADGTIYADGSRRWQCGFCDEGSADSNGCSSPYMIDVEPSHWMPLPEPPK